MELRSHKSHIKTDTRDLNGNSYVNVLRNAGNSRSNISEAESAKDNQKYEDELLNEIIRTGSQKSSLYVENRDVTKRLSDTHSIRSRASNNSSDSTPSPVGYRRKYKRYTDKDLEEGLGKEIVDLRLADTSLSLSSKNSRSVYSSASRQRGLGYCKGTEYPDKESILSTSESDLDGERFPSYVTTEKFRLQDNRRSYTSRHTPNHKPIHKQNHIRSRDGSFVMQQAFKDNTNSPRSSRNLEEIETSINKMISLSGKSGEVSTGIKRSQTDVGPRPSLQNNYSHRGTRHLSYHESIIQRSIQSQHSPSSKSTTSKNYSKRHSDPSLFNSKDRSNFIHYKSSLGSHNDSIFQMPISEEPNQEATLESEINLRNGLGNVSRKTSRATHQSSSGRDSAVRSSTHQNVGSRKNETGEADSIGSASSIARVNSRMSRSSGSNIQSMEDPDDQILVGDEKDIHDAARVGDHALVEQLCDVGTDVNCRNETDRTPIHWAAGNGHIETLKVLLEKDSNIDAADKFGMNALLWSAWFGHKECLQMLLRAGAKVNARNKNGYTFLHCSAQNNHVMAADIIAEDLQEFDVNTVDDAGRTCIHVMAKHGRKEMLLKFIELKSNIHVKDKAGNTALHLAAKYGFSELLPILVEAGAKLEEKNLEHKTALHLAAEEGKQNACVELLNLDADINAETIDEVCPIHLAVSGAHEELVEILVGSGADIDAGNKHNQTPLHYAVVANRPGIVSILTSMKADPNVQDARGETPMHLATENGYTDIAELLLCTDINLSVTDQRGKTALDVAARGSYITIVDMILKAERYHMWKKQSEQGTSHLDLDYTNDIADDEGQLLFKPDNSLETEHIRTLLYKLAKKYLKNGEWRKLAFHWGFTDSQVQAIQEQYTGEKSHREHGYRMLLIWLNGCILKGENPVRSLFEGLVAIQRRDLAEIMRAKANSLPSEKSCIIA